MRSSPASMPIVALLALVGCGTSASVPPLPTPVVYPDVSGNWQIQSASSTVPVVANSLGVVLLGALGSSGSQVRGVFRLIDFQASNGCGNIGSVILVSGTVDPAGNLRLASSPFAGGAVLTAELGPAATAGFREGTVAISGTTCSFASSSAIGLELPPLTGTYSGPLSAGPPSSSPGINAGTATLTLTQAATAQSDGQFPLTGQVQYTLGSCTATVPLAGTVSGVGGMALATGPGLSLTTVNVIENPAVPSSLPAVLFTGSCLGGGNLPTFAEYSGTLTKS